MINKTKLASGFLILSLAIFGIVLMSRNTQAQVVNPSKGGSGSSATSTVVTNATSSPIPVNIVTSTISFATTQTSTVVTNTSSSPVLVSLATLIAGENIASNYLAVEQDFSYNFINTANSTTTIKSAAGYLQEITISNPSTTASTTIKIFDSTTGSGTQIAQLVIPQSLAPVTLLFNVAYSTGLSIQETGATSSITASYR